MRWEQRVLWRPIKRLAWGFHFVQYEKLGTGLSDPSNGRATIDERIEELTAVLDAAGVGGTWLGGFSGGGGIPLPAGARTPERGAGVVVGSTYPGKSALGEGGGDGPGPSHAQFDDVL